VSKNSLRVSRQSPGQGWALAGQVPVVGCDSRILSGGSEAIYRGRPNRLSTGDKTFLDSCRPGPPRHFLINVGRNRKTESTPGTVDSLGDQAAATNLISEGLFVRIHAKLKLGYYPLNRADADGIRRHLQFPNESSSVLDPCAGTGAFIQLSCAGPLPIEICRHSHGTDRRYPADCRGDPLLDAVLRPKSLALEPLPRASQVRPAVDLAVG
jgi:hypothetical protein